MADQGLLQLLGAARAEAKSELHIGRQRIRDVHDRFAVGRRLQFARDVRDRGEGDGEDGHDAGQPHQRDPGADPGR